MEDRISISLWYGRQAVSIWMTSDPLYTRTSKPYRVYESIGSLDMPLETPPPIFDRLCATYEEALAVMNERYDMRLPRHEIAPPDRPAYVDIRKANRKPY